MKDYKNISEYIKAFPKDVQIKLRDIRAVMKKVAPDGEEAIRYGMPTLRIGGKNALHYAAYAKHVGFYPTPSGIKKFQKEIGKYVSSKGAVQFPLDKPVPMSLITKISKFRIGEIKGKM